MSLREKVGCPNPNACEKHRAFHCYDCLLAHHEAECERLSRQTTDVANRLCEEIRKAEAANAALSEDAEKWRRLESESAKAMTEWEEFRASPGYDEWKGSTVRLHGEEYKRLKDAESQVAALVSALRPLQAWTRSNVAFVEDWATLSPVLDQVRDLSTAAAEHDKRVAETAIDEVVMFLTARGWHGPLSQIADWRRRSP